MSQFDDAVELLNKCVRSELRDHAFGDTEVSWFLDGKFVAEGYYGGGLASVSVNDGGDFNDADARELRKCGTEGQVERNDETGPEDYQEGVTMPGLTLEGVLKEITTSPKEQ
jgi:hypothetical protein